MYVCVCCNTTNFFFFFFYFRFPFVPHTLFELRDIVPSALPEDDERRVKKKKALQKKKKKYRTRFVLLPFKYRTREGQGLMRKIGLKKRDPPSDVRVSELQSVRVLERQSVRALERHGERRMCLH